jgi:stage V sporulation protein R
MSLAAWVDRAWAAAEAGGWQPADTEFWVVDPGVLFGLAVAGLPGHPPHWTYGRDYWLFASQQRSGASRLFELVVPGQPCQAYLSAWNAASQHEAVVLHVIGHVDLFRTHPAFQEQRADWPAVWQAGVARLRATAGRVGADQVEQLWTWGLSLVDQVADDPPRTSAEPPGPSPWRALDGPVAGPVRTPPPETPATRDVLGFVARHSPVLPEWARDALLLLRGQALWEAPMRRTKWVHEAFATWTQHELAAALGWAGAARVETARGDAFVQWRHPVRLNWYDLGLRLCRWWAARLGPAGVRAACRRWSDAAWLDQWLTPDAIADLELWPYGWAAADGALAAVRQAADPDAVRTTLLNQLVARPPRVQVLGVDGVTLQLGWDDPAPPDVAWAQRTLAAVQGLWGGPVVLEAGVERISPATGQGGTWRWRA